LGGPFLRFFSSFFHSESGKSSPFPLSTLQGSNCFLLLARAGARLPLPFSPFFFFRFEIISVSYFPFIAVVLFVLFPLESHGRVFFPLSSPPSRNLDSNVPYPPPPLLKNLFWAPSPPFSPREEIINSFPFLSPGQKLDEFSPLSSSFSHLRRKSAPLFYLRTLSFSLLSEDGDNSQPFFFLPSRNLKTKTQWFFPPFAGLRAGFLLLFSSAEFGCVLFPSPFLSFS